MSKHTPGPWLVEHDTDITGSEASPEIGCIGKVDIAHVYLRSVPGKTEANARLIAAAPCMAEALQALIACDFGAGGWDAAAEQAATKARAAWAKATGGEG